MSARRSVRVTDLTMMEAVRPSGDVTNLSLLANGFAFQGYLRAR